MNYAIILAGGVGSRFWPLSSSHKPKQFLKIYSGKSLIEETLHRISGLIKREKIYIATSETQIKRMRNYLKGMPARNFFFEPQGRNTFAPIAFLSDRISKIDADAIIAVLPSDHYIKNRDRFVKILNHAIDIASQGYIVTLGVRPRRAETGYGYIKVKAKEKAGGFYSIKEFIEKPLASVAGRLIRSKKCYWNAGIFIFKASVMLQEIKKMMPVAYSLIKRMKTDNDLMRAWQRLPEVSIDYAIMERTKKMALIPADFGWNDLGSWQALEEVMQKDKSGNILKGNTVALDCRNTIVWADKRLVATLGLKDLIVVDTKDALLVCSKDKAQDVKKLVEILKHKRLAG